MRSREGLPASADNAEGQLGHDAPHPVRHADLRHHGLRTDRRVPGRDVPDQHPVHSMSLPYHIGNGWFGGMLPPRDRARGGRATSTTASGTRSSALRDVRRRPPLPQGTAGTSTCTPTSRSTPDRVLHAGVRPRPGSFDPMKVSAQITFAMSVAFALLCLGYGAAAGSPAYRRAPATTRLTATFFWGFLGRSARQRCDPSWHDAPRDRPDYCGFAPAARSSRACSTMARTASRVEFFSSACA